MAILDELTTGLDLQARRDTWTLVEQIRDSGVTVVLVTHYMEEAERLVLRQPTFALSGSVPLPTCWEGVVIRTPVRWQAGRLLRAPE